MQLKLVEPKLTVILHCVLSTFEAENRLFHNYAEAQLKKSLLIKKSVYRHLQRCSTF